LDAKIPPQGVTIVRNFAVIGIISDAIRAFDDDLPARNNEIARLRDGGISTQPKNRCGVIASYSAHDEGHS
jgi:hypothetical protein